LHTARCVTKQFTSYHVQKIALDSHIHIQIYLKQPITLQMSLSDAQYFKVNLL